MDHPVDPCIVLLCMECKYNNDVTEVDIEGAFYLPKRKWFLDYDTVDGTTLENNDECFQTKDTGEKEDNSDNSVVLQPITEADKSGVNSAKVHFNSTARGSQQTFDPGNMSSIYPAGSQDSQSAVKKKTSLLMRDFVTEDKSEWKRIKKFPLKFQAEILNGKIQISGTQQEERSIVYKPRTRITVVERDDNSRNNSQQKRTEKEKKKHSRSKPRQGTFSFQDGMTYCLTDIPEDRFAMIYKEKYLGHSMEKLYQHHQKTAGKNWDQTHNKQDYMKTTILKELKETYRFLEIMQSDQSDSNIYSSSGN